MTSMKKEEYWREADKAQTESPEAYYRALDEYQRQVKETEGFDVEGIVKPIAPFIVAESTGVSQYHMKKEYPYHFIVDLYAKMGLHRYNMLEGTNLQLVHIIKFNTMGNCLISYFITLLASDPLTCLEQTFQVKVIELSFGRLDLAVTVARPKRSMVPTITTHTRQNDRLFEWPSEDEFNDTRRFYMVEETELRDTDWIRLYLELTLCSKKDRKTEASDLSKLKIVKVAIETSDEDVEAPNKAKGAITEDVEPPHKAKSAVDEDVEPPNKRLEAESSVDEDVELSYNRLNAKNAIVYITFRSASHGISEHVERRAIVRRMIDERTGKLIVYDAMTPFPEDTGFIQRLLQTPVSPEVLAMVRSRSLQ